MSRKSIYFVLATLAIISAAVKFLIAGTLSAIYILLVIIVLFSGLSLLRNGKNKLLHKEGEHKK